MPYPPLVLLGPSLYSGSAKGPGACCLGCQGDWLKDKLGCVATLISIPADPWSSLIDRDLPQGDPWGWLYSQLLLESRLLARKVLQGQAGPGWRQLVAADLEELRRTWRQLASTHPLEDLGLRAPHPAEQAAREVLMSGDPEALFSLYRHFGYAPFDRCSAFRYDGELHVVPDPDAVSFADLVGCEEQNRLLRRNVERFLNRQPSLSTLLYGARGSGKSSAVKALRTAYAAQGLRLVEITPEGLGSLHLLLEELRLLPQRFVLYLDDLSLSSVNPMVHLLRGLLEGGVHRKPDNLLVIATSNRRNVVSESWRDRPDPDAGPHAWDDLQDQLALADRFGLVLTYPPLDQERYLAIVSHLLRRPLDPELHRAALRFALEGRGFSGRTARQFVDWL